MHMGHMHISIIIAADIFFMVLSPFLKDDLAMHFTTPESLCQPLFLLFTVLFQQSKRIVYIRRRNPFPRPKGCRIPVFPIEVQKNLKISRECGSFH